jgi:uncharacterized membrane protein YkvA (DUF1232 family)
MIQYTGKRKKKIIRLGAVSFAREIFVLYFAMRDSRTPIYAKIIAFLAIAYLLSPIDLIPDFIPVVGYLDDIIVVPLLLHIAFSTLPQEVRETGWANSKKHMVLFRVVLIFIFCLIIAIFVALFLLVKSFFHQ